MFEMWCRDQIYSVSYEDAWTIYPADVIYITDIPCTILDALFSSHREKIGYPHDEVSNLTTQGLHGHKTLTEVGQMSLRANFQDYMMHGMHNNPISDIKQLGQRVIEFGTKREESVHQCYQHRGVSWSEEGQVPKSITTTIKAPLPRRL